MTIFSANFFYLDAETRPSVDPDILAQIEAEITPPSNMSIPATIQKWEETKKPKLVLEKLSKTALSPLDGRLLSVAYAHNRGPTECLINTGDITEEKLMTTITDRYAELTDANDGVSPDTVGFNTEFDFRFLMFAALRAGDRPRVNIINDMRKSNVDMMKHLYGWSLKDARSLRDTNRQLTKRPEPAHYDTQIHELLANENYNAIVKHNEFDVNCTRDLHELCGRPLANRRRNR